MKQLFKLATLLFIISLTVMGAYASTITVSGYPSKDGYGYSYGTFTYLDYCPLCGATDCLLDNPKQVECGEITCAVCDADYDIWSGQDKAHVVRATLTRANVFKFSFPVVWNYNYSGMEV